MCRLLLYFLGLGRHCTDRSFGVVVKRCGGPARNKSLRERASAASESLVGGFVGVSLAWRVDLSEASGR